MVDLRKHCFVLLAAFLAIALLVFYWPWLSGAQSFYFEDLTNFFQPLCTFVGEGLRAGHLPLWNPYSYCGMSEAAVSSPGIFYPLNWLFAVSGFNVSLSLIMVLSQLVCGLGTYLLIRSFRWERCPAVLASITLTMTGYMFSLANNYTLPSGAAWIPLILYCTRELCRAATTRSTVLWMGALAGSLFMHVAAGRPEISGPGLFLAIFYAGYEVLNVPSADRLEKLMNVIKAFFIGALLTMPSTLPLIEWTPWSRRAEGLLAPEVMMFSANWFDLVSMFASHPLGDIQMRTAPYRVLVLVRNLGPYYASAFIGAPVLALALVGISKRGGPLYRLGLLGLVISIITSLGSNVPLADQIVEHLPLLSILRFPCKYLFFTVLILAMFAARGLNLYRTGKTVNLLVAAACLGVCALWAVIGLSTSSIVFPFYRSAIHSLPEMAYINAQHMLSSNLLIATLLGGATLLILHLMRNNRSAGAAAASVLAGMVLLTNAFVNYRTGAPPDYFKQPSFAAQKLQEAWSAPGGDAANRRMITLFLERFTVPQMYNLPDPLNNTIGAYQYSRQAARPFTNVSMHLPSAFGFEGAMVGEYFYLLYNSYLASSQWTRLDPETQAPIKTAPANDKPLARLLQLAATPYVITQDYRYAATTGQYTTVPPLDPQYFTQLFSDHDHNIRLFKLSNAMPRAYFTYAWRNMTSRDSMIELISTPTSKFDPNQTTLVEADQQTPVGETQGSINPLKIEEPQPERVTMEVDAQKTALVVFADQYYPGWRAIVDGGDVEISRVNGYFRGVFVPQGKHTIEFQYEPDSVKYGLLLAAIGFLWWAALLYSARRSTPSAAGSPQ